MLNMFNVHLYIILQHFDYIITLMVKHLYFIYHLLFIANSIDILFITLITLMTKLIWLLNSSIRVAYISNTKP